MALPPIVKPQYPNVPNAPGVPPMLRQIGAIQATAVLLGADAIQIAQMFQSPMWGIYAYGGAPILASSSTVQQIVNSVEGTISQLAVIAGYAGSASFACSVGSLGFSQDYRISSAPQEQGAFLSYNKVQNPFESHISFIVGGTAASRSAFLSTIDALAASFSLFNLVTPEVVYHSVNVMHYDYRRTNRSGVAMLTVDVWVEQVRVTGTTAYSNTATPSGADPVNVGSAQGVPLPAGANPEAGGAPPAGGLT